MNVVLMTLIVGPSWPVGSIPINDDKVQIHRADGMTTASVKVDVPLARAWDVLTSYETTGPQMPDIKKAKLISRNGNVVRLQQSYQAPYTFGLRVDALLEIEELPRTQIKYKMLRGEFIRRLKGHWKIVPVKEGINLVHKIYLEPEIPSILQPVFLELSEENLRQSMEALRQLMLSSSKTQHPVDAELFDK